MGRHGAVGARCQRIGARRSSRGACLAAQRVEARAVRGIRSGRPGTAAAPGGRSTVAHVWLPRRRRSQAGSRPRPECGRRRAQWSLRPVYSGAAACGWSPRGSHRPRKAAEPRARTSSCRLPKVVRAAVRPQAPVRRRAQAPSGCRILRRPVPVPAQDSGRRPERSIHRICNSSCRSATTHRPVPRRRCSNSSPSRTFPPPRSQWAWAQMPAAG